MSRSRKPGRPRSEDGRVPLTLSVPPYVDRWLKSGRKASQTVKQLVDEQIEKEGKK